MPFLLRSVYAQRGRAHNPCADVSAFKLNLPAPSSPIPMATVSIVPRQHCCGSSIIDTLNWADIRTSLLPAPVFRNVTRRQWQQFRNAAFSAKVSDCDSTLSDSSMAEMSPIELMPNHSKPFHVTVWLNVENAPLHRRNRTGQSTRQWRGFLVNRACWFVDAHRQSSVAKRRQCWQGSFHNPNLCRILCAWIWPWLVPHHRSAGSKGIPLAAASHGHRDYPGTIRSSIGLSP